MSWAWPFWKEPPESPLASSWRSTTRHFTASWTWGPRAQGRGQRPGALAATEAAGPRRTESPSPHTHTPGAQGGLSAGRPPAHLSAQDAVHHDDDEALQRVEDREEDLEEGGAAVGDGEHGRHPGQRQQRQHHAGAPQRGPADGRVRAAAAGPARAWPPPVSPRGAPRAQAVCPPLPSTLGTGPSLTGPSRVLPATRAPSRGSGPGLQDGHREGRLVRPLSSEQRGREERPGRGGDRTNEAEAGQGAGVGGRTGAETDRNRLTGASFSR